MTGSLRSCTLVAGKNLRLEIRFGESFLVIAPFGAAALFLTPIAVGTDLPLLREVGPGMYWVVVLLFGALIALRQTGAEGPTQADMLTLAGVPPVVRLLGSAIASGVLLLGLEVVLAPVVVMLYDPPLTGWPWLLAVLPGVAAGLALLGSIAEGLLESLGMRTTLGPLLIIPLALPLLLGATQAREAANAGAAPVSWLLLILAVDLVLLLAVLFTGRMLEDVS